MLKNTDLEHRLQHCEDNYMKLRISRFVGKRKGATDVLTCVQSIRDFVQQRTQTRDLFDPHRNVFKECISPFKDVPQETLYLLRRHIVWIEVVRLLLHVFRLLHLFTVSRLSQDRQSGKEGPDNGKMAFSSVFHLKAF